MVSGAKKYFFCVFKAPYRLSALSMQQRMQTSSVAGNVIIGA